MSQENVEVTRQLIQAFNRRDLEAMTERFDPEIEWTPGGPAAMERAVYRGPRRGLGRVFRDLGDLGGVPPRRARGS